MQKTIISLITGIIVGLFPVIYSNWVNSRDLKLDIFNDEIRFTAPSLRQNTENKISILVIQEPLYISAYSIDKISVTTENTIGSQPYYLFSKAHKENTIFILIFTTLGSLIILLIIAFVIDILTPYKKKKASQIESLEKLIKENGSEKELKDFQTSIKKLI